MDDGGGSAIAVMQSYTVRSCIMSQPICSRKMVHFLLLAGSKIASGINANPSAAMYSGMDTGGGSTLVITKTS